MKANNWECNGPGKGNSKSPKGGVNLVCSRSPKKVEDQGEWDEMRWERQR